MEENGGKEHFNSDDEVLICRRNVGIIENTCPIECTQENTCGGQCRGSMFDWIHMRKKIDTLKMKFDFVPREVLSMDIVLYV